MLHYMLQIFAFQAFFLIIYDVFLRGETFFNWNRFYLLGTGILSICLPFIRIDEFKSIVPQKYIITLPEIILGENNNEVMKSFTFNSYLHRDVFSWSLELIFSLGIIITAIIFVLKIAKLFRLVYKNPKSRKDSLLIIELDNSNTAFSFFHFVFLGKLIKAEDQDLIIKHELIHVQQNHTIDLLIFEVLRIFLWFNPLIYMYQNRIASLHEFIADKEASKNNNTKYYESMLAQVFDVKHISFVNPFFKQSLIKKRIIMLSKSKSKQIHLIKYALLIPMVIGMLIYTSCTQEKDSEQLNQTIVKDSLDNSSLTNKIADLKEQLQVQGGVSDKENKALKLLLKSIQSDVLDLELVNNVQTFINSENKTELEDKISIVFNQMQEQGNISDDEYKSLKTLLLLTSEDGFKNPFFDDVVKFAEIPFGVIDNVPVFPGCEENLNKRDCFITSITKHVSKNFNIKLANELKLNGIQEIKVKFIINHDGKATDISAKSSHPKLTEEAIRVVKLLPKMTPGSVEGKYVNVPYALPIKFKIQE